MQIKFADGTTLTIALTALDAFLKHDLKWVEFVHGKASIQAGAKLPVQPATKVSASVTRCPGRAC
ncbi:MAG TPA: hypothetical protein VHN74_17865 [Candidatus Angelobacter sp.]|jgi:hypothetical protein|nr:hypothetical protein [Candidatus Angelobacter sp.]